MKLAPAMSLEEDEERSVEEEKGEGGREHHSLKYHLLGPSLSKAGQDFVDQQKVCDNPLRKLEG